MSDSARSQLPKVVNAIGDKLGLQYGDRKAKTKKYIEENKDATRLDYEHLKNSSFWLDDPKIVDTQTKKKNKPKKLSKGNLSTTIPRSIFKISPEDKAKMQYSLFERLNSLWEQYAKQVVANKTDTLGLFRMDLHGCKILVKESKNPTLIGFEGIIFQESKNTFLCITKTNKLSTIPKRECVFEFKIDNDAYKINGCNLLFTVQARTKLKYKKP